ncbi:hypothetical protein H6P81_002901 [Aristolochia fimbriata]|uniref:Flavin-containing monooxygenase n=1 Tax=Aristolochia fimbriata TaxID=158543 RepID=A0AAV7FBA4_ARIFI|nr:hypothetical protein H6P81_002901 [Aristolochia fimbriata]
MVVPGIRKFLANGVELDDGSVEEFNSVILATGYRSNVPSWLKGDLFSKEDGFPKKAFPNSWKGEGSPLSYLNYLLYDMLFIIFLRVAGVPGLLVVSSMDVQPLNKFVDLFNTNQLPSLLNDGAMDPKILKHYLLVQDYDFLSETSLDTLLDESGIQVSADIEEEVRRRFENAGMQAYSSCIQANPQIVFQKVDLFFVCMLKPLSYDIQKQDLEIEAAQWMPIEEYAALPYLSKYELLKYILDICLAKIGKGYSGFSPVPTKSAFSGEESYYMYLNAKDLM